jgi:hypothetical protein
LPIRECVQLSTSLVDDTDASVIAGVAKYNALIRIEDEIHQSGAKTLYAGAQGFSVGPKVRLSLSSIENAADAVAGRSLVREGISVSFLGSA